MEYKTAETYKNWERIGDPYAKDNKLYTKIKNPCPRCNGKGIIIARVENGIPIPIPVDQGICYNCLGDRYIYKEARLYTKKEYETMQKNKERARIRRQEKAEEEIRTAAPKNKAKWLAAEGFNAEGITYVIKGETYSIKDELKEAGFRFNRNLMWHVDHVINKYADRLKEIHYNDICEFSAWGQGSYIIDKINELHKEITRADSESEYANEWYAEDRFKELRVTLVKKSGFEGMYGWTNIYSFKTVENILLTWFTSTTKDILINNEYLISGSVKDRIEYKGDKVTKVTRCRIKEV